MRAQDYTLHSGGGAGTEAFFGETAEQWEVAEITYSFEGHEPHRTRGLKVLTQQEMLAGDVSLAYVGQLMNRTYKDTPTFRNVLRSIWQQINAAEQVFVIGWINADGTVKGGTGWGAEVAKLGDKALHVFDLDEGAWFQWHRGTFERCEDPPSITATNFTGTGTQLLNDSGRQAIKALFERSFS